MVAAPINVVADASSPGMVFLLWESPDGPTFSEVAVDSTDTPLVANTGSPNWYFNVENDDPATYTDYPNHQVISPGPHVFYVRLKDGFDEHSEWTGPTEEVVAEPYVPTPEPDLPSIDVNIGGVAYKIAASDVGNGRIAQYVIAAPANEVMPTTLYNDDAITSTDNPLPVVQHRAPEATTTVIPVSDTPVEVMPSNIHRHGIVFWNNSDTRCYIMYGDNTDAAYPLNADERYEPSQPSVTTGAMSVYWDAEATGDLHATELY